MKLNELIEGGFKECKNIERNISISEDAYNMLLSAHNDLSKLTDKQQRTIETLRTELLDARHYIEDAKIYLNELRHCANTNNQHSIINEALRLLPEFKSVGN